MRLVDDGVARLGEALDVRLVDDGVGVLVLGWPVGAPVEERVDHHRLGHAGSRVIVVAAVRVPEVITEKRLVPVEHTVDGLGIRIEQKLVRIAALSSRGVVRAIDAVTVALSRLDGGQICMPHEGVDLRQFHLGFRAVDVEEAQANTLGHLAEQGEVRSRPPS